MALVNLNRAVLGRWIPHRYIERGLQYLHEGRVRLLDAFEAEEEWVFRVMGVRPYTVTIFGTQEESLDAECECPVYHGGEWCKHIAAALLYLIQPPPEVSPVEAGPSDLAARFLHIFRPAVAPKARDVLTVQFFLHTVPKGSDFVLQLELKVGPKKPYVVKNVGDFLEAVAQPKPYRFTDKFWYRPEDHTFDETSQRIFSLLDEMVQQRRFYERQINPYSYTVPTEPRILAVQPDLWPRLAPLLAAALTMVGSLAEPFELGQGPLPLDTVVTPDGPGRYSLKINGLPGLFLLPLYHTVFWDNVAYLLSTEEFAALAELHKLARHRPALDIGLTADDLPVALAQALPVLDRLGQVTIDPAVSSQVVDVPVVLRVYLDWMDDMVAARVDFVYGTWVLHYGEPLPPDAPVIIRRTPEESALLEHLARAGFRDDGGRWILTEEETLFVFLTEGLEVLESVAEVYATPRFESLLGRQETVRPTARVELDQKLQWLDVSFSLDGIDSAELPGILQALIEKKVYHRLTNGAFLALKDPDLQKWADTLYALGVNPRTVNGSQARVPALGALSLLDGAPAAMKLGRTVKQWLEDLRHPEAADIPVPSSLASILREYQVAGFQWFKTLARYGFGGILADDMGLGKTIQTIAFLLSEWETGAMTEPALIVAPASLTYNWQSELLKFAPVLRVGLLTGNKSEREKLLENLDAYDVLITSYPLIRRDIDQYRALSFHALILDEAQMIKNQATQTAQAVTEVPSRHRFALTGTPVENSLDDLWSIFHAVFPELLGGKAAFGRLTPEQVAKRVRPFILRRVKRDVLRELPDRIDSVHYSDLTPDQKKIYLAYLSQFQKETREELARQGLDKSRFKILAGLTRLRQICAHPALFLENYDGGSGKLDQLVEVLEECRDGGQGVLIFSQFTSMLTLMKPVLTSHDWPFFYLDGNTPSADRQSMVTRFNQGERSLFLISLRAGGTGLNLTGADTVILYDLWWNPQVDEQAIGRAHRLGQRNVVQVIRLIAQGTIEDKIYELQQKKSALVDQVLSHAAESLERLTEDDIRELLAL
ncbi:MAG: DEAD/DEAH box helicase [Sulfobacillus sp.]|nr:DEAD/DEAH box helicase [Sulfobacillus sp.]